MRVTRQDAWTKDEDLILAETTLKYIREGKTQLDAFKEVGKTLSRTPAACGFRWNSTLRKQYEEAIERAKEERKSGSLTTINLKGTSDYFLENVKEAIQILTEVKHFSEKDFTNLTSNGLLVKQLKEENDELKRKVKRYEEAWREMGRLWAWVKNGEES